MNIEAKVLLPSTDKPKVDEMLAFLDTLDQSGRRSLLDFFYGAQFMQSLMTNTQLPAAKDSA